MNYKHFQVWSSPFHLEGEAQGQILPHQKISSPCWKKEFEEKIADKDKENKDKDKETKKIKQELDLKTLALEQAQEQAKPSKHSKGL